MSTLETTLARVRADIDTLRAEASEHTRAATTLGDQLTAPSDHLTAMARRETEMTRREADLAAELERVRADLQALRLEMVDTRRQVDELTGQRDGHLRAADQAAKAAAYYEGTTLPHMAALLEGPAPHVALADTGLMPEPPKVVEDGRVTCAEMGCTSCLGCGDCACHRPGTGPFNVVPASPETVAAVLGSVRPAEVTMPDVGAHPVPNPPTEPEPDAGPRHAKPSRRPGVTGAFKALGDRITGSQDGDSSE